MIQQFHLWAYTELGEYDLKRMVSQEPTSKSGSRVREKPLDLSHIFR